MAFAWCTGHGDLLNYGSIGYLPEYSRMSPGTALLCWILEDLFASKEFRIFDFGPGESWDKESFATGVAEYIGAVLLRPQRRHWALVGLHAGLEWCSAMAGAALNRLSAKSAVKRVMRTVGGVGAS